MRTMTLTRDEGPMVNVLPDSEDTHALRIDFSSREAWGWEDRGREIRAMAAELWGPESGQAGADKPDDHILYYSPSW
jgi:hypothetical protein